MGGVPNDILEQVSCRCQKGCKATFILVAKLILYVQMHVCVTKVRIAKSQLILVTKNTGMINKSHFFVLTFFLRHFDIALRYVLSFLTVFCQIIVTARNKIRIGKQNLGILTKRKYFKGIYMKKESYNLLTYFSNKPCGGEH